MSKEKSVSSPAEKQTFQAIVMYPEKKKPSELEKENGLCLDALFGVNLFIWSGVSGCHTSHSLEAVTTSLFYFSTFSICHAPFHLRKW